MIADVKMNVNQLPVDVLTEGQKDYPAISKIGQLFTASWHERLILAGLAHSIGWLANTGSGNVTMLGGGTTLDLDLPMGSVAIDSGFLIPMSLELGLSSDMDADADEVDILVTADRATAVPGSEFANYTAGVPLNQLDGGPTFQGRSGTICTSTEITDPVHAETLFFHTYRTVHAGTAANQQTSNLNIDKVWKFPVLLAGGCTIHIYWGGAEATTGLGRFVFAHIPAAYAPVV